MEQEATYTVLSRSQTVPTPPAIRPSVIAPGVHDSSAPLVCFVDALDTGSSCTWQPPWPT